MLDIGVLTVLSYDSDCIVQRVCMDSIVDGLKNLVCNEWRVFIPWSIELSYLKEFKHSVIETNLDLQSLAAFY